MLKSEIKIRRRERFLKKLTYMKKNRVIIVNQRGLLVADFMATNGFLLFNGRTMNDRPARPTFTRHREECDRLSLGKHIGIKDLRVVLVEPTLSDHFPVELHLRCADVTETHVTDDSVH